MIHSVVDSIRTERVVNLARSLVRIPSPRFEEARLAEYVAGFLEGVGLEVHVQEVNVGSHRSKQVIGKIQGSGDGPTLMLCGHLDTTPMYRDDLWTVDPLAGVVQGDGLYGWGAGNMKCGLAAMLCAAESLNGYRAEFKGSLVVACVMGETAGGVGVDHLIRSGIRADMAIVPERTGLDVVTVTIGTCRGRIEVEGRMRFRADGGEIHPIEKAMSVVSTFPSSYKPVPEGDWLAFRPHPQLPGFPQWIVTGLQSRGDFCSIDFDVRIVPGMTEEGVRMDVQRVLHRLCSADPHLKVKLVMPPDELVRNRQLPDALSETESIVQTVARCHQRIIGEWPAIGAGRRLGSPADASDLILSGAKTVTYGPGVSDPWPTADEKNSIDETVKSAKVLALTALTLCAEEIGA